MRPISSKSRAFLSYSAISLAVSLFFRILTGVALAADPEGDIPTWLATPNIFDLFVYGSIVGLTVATLAIIGVWLKEVAQKTAW